MPPLWPWHAPDCMRRQSCQSQSPEINTKLMILLLLFGAHFADLAVPPPTYQRGTLSAVQHSLGSYRIRPCHQLVASFVQVELENKNSNKK